MTDRILVAGPSITALEVGYVEDAVLNSCGANSTAWVGRFERAVADYVGRNYAVAVPHCTSAIHLALLALGIGPGDEVIVPDVTWLASVAPIVHVGATPVLVDIRRDTWCIDHQKVIRAVTPKTKAILGVDLYGGMCDWMELEGYGIATIEDAAESMGSQHLDWRAGHFGDVSVFSFHGTKTVSTGEGGMLVTDDESLYTRVLRLRDNGRPPGDRHYQFTEFAYKYRMNNVTAALGCAQMERIDELVARKRRIFGWYAERLKDLPLQMNAEPPGTFNSYWMTTVIPDTRLDKFALMAEFDKRGIDTRPFFSRLSDLPVFRDRRESTRFVERGGQFPVTWSEPWTHGVNLPSAHGLTEADVDRVCAALREILSSVTVAA